MLRLVLVASLLVGCRISLDEEELEDPLGGRTCNVNTASTSCMAAEQHADLAWIEANVFQASCTFSGCHGASSPVNNLDLRVGKSHARLVNVNAELDATRKLVVPNNVKASFLMLMLHDFAPSEAIPPAQPPTAGDPGYMPKGNRSLCCQKLDALERWINDGAQNN